MPGQVRRVEMRDLIAESAPRRLAAARDPINEGQRGDKRHCMPSLNAGGIPRRLRSSAIASRVLGTLPATTNGKHELTVIDSESGNIGPGDQYHFALQADIPINDTGLGSGPFDWTDYANDGTVECEGGSGTLTYTHTTTAPGQLQVTAIKTQPTLAVDLAITDPSYSYNITSTCQGIPTGPLTSPLNPLFRPIDFGTGAPVTLLPNGQFEVTGWTHTTGDNPTSTVTLNEEDGTMTMTLTGTPQAPAAGADHTTRLRPATPSTR